jgi:thioredoxin-like negative regulator of GroEL
MLRPEDAEARVDLAVALSHVGERDEAIKANREAIRLASLGSRSADRRRRIRVAAYFNLGKLKVCSTAVVCGRQRRSLYVHAP